MPIRQQDDSLFGVTAMRKYKLCLGTNDQFGLPNSEQIALFKETGFDAFFMGYCGKDSVSEARAAADKNKMIFQSVHAPFGRMNEMWADGKSAADELIQCVHACADNGVPIMVAHTYIGFGESGGPNEKGFENFGRVIDEASRFGITVALENTEGEEYLDALMAHFADNPTVKFCWDSGHEQCYNKGRDLLLSYGDRLAATHLNDNLGVKSLSGETTYFDDLHLLPFDGIIDWKLAAEKLDQCGFDGIMTFELNTISKPGRHENDKYSDMPIERYIAEAYARACRVEALRSR